MKVTINRTDLAEALATVGHAVGKPNVLPILSTVHVVALAAGGTLTLRATDLDVQLTAVIGDNAAKVSEPGEACIPHKRLKDIVANATSEAIAMESGKRDGHVIITAGDYIVDLLCMPVDEHAPVAFAPSCAPLDIPGEALIAALSVVRAAQSADSTLLILNSICVGMTESGKLRTVAADGRRLHVCGANDGKETSQSCTIPTRGVDCAMAIIAEGEPAALRIGDKSFALTTPRGELVGKLVEGAYPNWRQVIPDDTGTVATVACDDMAESVKRVSLVNAEACRLDVRAGQCRVSATGADIGKASDAIGCALDGEAVAVSVNPQYLRDALAACAKFCDEARVGIRGVGNPVTLESGNLRVVIMPLRMQDEVEGVGK